MKRLLGLFIDVRKGEILLTLLMFAYYYLTLGTIYFLKPARDSLFLVRLGAAQLPFTFILIALVVLPVTTFYARLSRALSINRLINATTFILIVNLIALRGLIGLDQTWVYYVFYIWVSIYGVLVTSQYWLFANALFNPAQAKRLFPLLNVGGILGAVTGGELTGFIVQTVRISTENLLFFCMGFSGLGVVLLNAVWAIRPKDAEEPPSRSRDQGARRDSFRQMVGTVRRCRSLVFIVGIVSVTVMVAAFVDFQFKSLSVATFPEKADLTSFLGKFYGRIGFVALLIQLLLSARMLRALGIGGTLLFLPVSLMFGSVALFIAPSLWTGMALRGADQSFRYSLQKTAQELLFLPVSLDMKKRVKVFIDVFVDQAAQGISGLLLLLCTAALGLSIRALSFVTFALTGVWIVLAVRAHREYVGAFRKALERREIDPRLLDLNIEESSTLATLTAALDSRNERQIVYALDMLDGMRAAHVAPAVENLLAHPSAEVRRKALHVIKTSRRAVPMEKVEPLLYDADQDVRVEAMGVICQCQQSLAPVRYIQSYLKHPDIKIRAAAISCIAEQGDPGLHAMISEDLVRTLLEQDGQDGVLVRIHVARALGALKTPRLQPYLRRLIDDPSLPVARSAIEGAGATGDPAYIPLLLTKLAERPYRASARNALAAFGDAALEPMRGALTDEAVDMMIRRNIPRVLRLIPVQKSADILLHALERVEPALKYPVVKALNKLRNYQTLRIAEEAVTAALIEEARGYYARLAILHLPWEKSPAADLLIRSLRDKQHQGLELVFRLLGLVYPPQDMYNAYEGVISANKTLRANAIEFLDNILQLHLKRYLMPVLDQASERTTIARGRELFDLRFDSIDRAAQYLIQGRDTWLRACAIATVADTASADTLHLVQEAQYDAQPLIRETSLMALRRVQSIRTA